MMNLPLALLVGLVGLMGTSPALGEDAKYVGSKSCEKCHPEQYMRWQDSAHSKMTQLATTETVVADFSVNNVLRWENHTYEMHVKDGKFSMTVRPPGGKTTTHPIDYTLGSHRIQQYMTELDDGRILLLPAFWHIPTQAWLDTSLITPSTDAGVGVRQHWNTDCVPCHATHMEFDFDLETRTYSTPWAELAIGCEACHGPGSKHNELFENNTSRDYVRTEMNDTFIVNQRYFDFVRSTEVCARCHLTRLNYFLGFEPGDRAYDFFKPGLMSGDSFLQQGGYYPDGRPTRFKQGQAFMSSKCFVQGKATCIMCHDAHGSENTSLLMVPKEASNVLCLNCHEDDYGGKKLTEHTFHLPDSPGSRCYECHMGEVLERLIMHRRDHSRDNPIPENSIRYGVPNSCNENCHANRTAEWTLDVLNQWYGDENRKKLLYASEAMWLAKGGNPDAIPLLIRVLDDPNLTLTLRASAASYLGKRFPDRAESAVPALIRQLGSEHRLLQVAAVDALGAIQDPRAVEPLSPLLDHESRILRIMTYSALFNHGLRQVGGEMGALMTRAKNEYRESLETWPSVAEFRVNIGNIHMLDEKFEEAAVEYEAALTLDPTLSDAWYYVGISYARLARWEDAVNAFEELRDADPAFPKVDELIRAAKQEIQGQ